MNSRQLAISREEHELWQKVCATLLKLGAVTDTDLKSKLKEHDTEGQRLLTLLRTWGDARVALARAQDKEVQ